MFIVARGPAERVVVVDADADAERQQVARVVVDVVVVGPRRRVVVSAAREDVGVAAQLEMRRRSLRLGARLSSKATLMIVCDRQRLRLERVPPSTVLLRSTILSMAELDGIMMTVRVYN